MKLHAELSHNNTANCNTMCIKTTKLLCAPNGSFNFK